MGRRIEELEARTGRRLDDIAKALLKVPFIRGPIRWLANSRLGWFFYRRFERLQSKRILTKVLRGGPVPNHVGIIMDGNRRFAQVIGLADVGMGHVAGQERLETVLDWCMEVNINILTVYAFSTENFNRTDPEQELLMELFEHNFRKMAVDKRIHNNQVRVRVIGDLERLPEGVQEAARIVTAATKQYSRYTFNVAVAYGGRQEIVDAVKAIARDVRDKGLRAEDITVESIQERLYTSDLPDPDFIIRTSGEERISNFLLWQLAYAELYFADVYWPQMDKAEFLRAIHEYQQRKRRYGS